MSDYDMLRAKTLTRHRHVASALDEIGRKRTGETPWNFILCFTEWLAAMNAEALDWVFDELRYDEASTEFGYGIFHSGVRGYCAAHGLPMYESDTGAAAHRIETYGMSLECWQPEAGARIN